MYRKDFTDAALEAAPTTPGMKYRHYSPTAPVILLDPSPPAAAATAAATAAAAAAGATAANGADSSHSSSANGHGSGDGEGLGERLRQATEALLAEMAGSALEGWRPIPALAGSVVTASSSSSGSSSSGCNGSSSRSVPLDPPTLELASRLAGGGAVGVLRTSLAGAPPGLLQRAPQAKTAAAAAHSQVDDGERGRSSGSGGVGGGEGAGTRAVAAQRVIEYVLGHVSRPAEVATELFAGLRALDEAGCVVIVVEGVADEGAGVAVMNRLRKAASRVVHV